MCSSSPDDRNTRGSISEARVKLSELNDPRFAGFSSYKPRFRTVGLMSEARSFLVSGVWFATPVPSGLTETAGPQSAPPTWTETKRSAVPSSRALACIVCEAGGDTSAVRVTATIHHYFSDRGTRMRNWPATARCFCAPFTATAAFDGGLQKADTAPPIRAT